MSLKPPAPPRSQSEWLITNGRGGYAMVALDGACRQTHHALLVMPARPPLQRVLLVRQLEEAIFVNGNWKNLSAEPTPSAQSQPRSEFLDDGVMPHFKISVEGIVIRKYLWTPQNGQGLFVRYELGKKRPSRLRVTPQICFRDLETGAPLAETYLVRPHATGIHLYGDPNEKPCAISANRAGKLYPVNSWRALQLFDPAINAWQSEEVYLPAAFEFDLQAGQDVTLMLELESSAKLENEKETTDADILFKLANERRQQQEHELSEVFSHQPIRNLALNGSSFIIERATTLTQNSRTILAGYPRLPDAGREAMIALPGLLLPTKQYDLAKEVFAHFLKHLHHGLIPHSFSSRAEAPNYASLDATLWMFVAIYEYWQASQDHAYIEEIYSLLLEILQAHLRGATPGFKLDAEDGLLFSVERRYPMTWMNAQAGDWQATPRHGKAVEVQALWYNALCIMVAFSEKLGKTEGVTRCSEYAERTAKNLTQKFWRDVAGHLYDCLIDASIIQTGAISGIPNNDNTIAVGDPTCRANQVIAVGLPFNVFTAEQTRAVIDLAVKKLVTPFGLRTLSPDHPAYCGEYAGSAKRLAAARHNGSVSPWLVLPFTRAYMKLYDNPRAVYEMFKPLFDGTKNHCAGHLAEMYDGDPPHHSRGASAYAASTGAILQSWQILQGKAI
jgi:predicted glycogen debranching enzyme